MATAIQKNGMKPLTNGSVNHVDDVGNLDGSTMCPVKREDVGNLDDSTLCPVKKEDGLFDVHAEPQVEDMDEKPELDIIINNVVCSFSVRCHLNLREIALNASNVEYRRENGMVRMKLRKPYTTASISSSGKVTCTGATSEDEAKKAARRFARSLQKLGFKVRFNNYRVVNVLGTCTMPWAIKITSFSIHHKDIVDYEPELHPGVTYKLKDLRATLKIFSTGSVTVTAPNVNAVQTAIEHIYPLVYEFRKERTKEEQYNLENRKRRLILVERLVTIHQTIIDEEEEGVENLSMEEEESQDSDASWA